MAEVKLSCLEAQFILRLLDERNVALEGVAKLLDENLKEENDPTGILIAGAFAARHPRRLPSSWVNF